MAWTNPKTWVPGELVTAAQLNQYIRDNMNAMFPVGSYLLRAASYTTTETAVEGRWLQCNGAAVSRTTYAALFAYLNSLTPALPFGVGNGSTTFTLPDLRGRTPYATGEHSTVDAMGDSDGTAIASRGPSHNHVTTIVAHGSGGNNNTAFGLGDVGVSSTNVNYTSGGGGALNVPGYLVVGSWFIKYTA
jgi:hypothetical protein